MALADVDGDGTLDIVAGANLADAEGTQSAVYLNDGAGGFTASESSACALPENAKAMRCFGLNDPTAVVGQVAVADVDSDGRVDIVVAYRGGENAVYLNSAQGTFSVANSFNILTAPSRNMALDTVAALAAADSAVAAGLAERGLALADVNADGAPDIVAGTSMQGSHVYLNDGAGHFDLSRAVPFGTGTEAISDVAAGDVDSDGDLDLVVGNDKQRSEVYLNDGAGAFPPGRSFGSTKARAVAVGDLNGDGKLDVITAEINAGVQVYLNDGKGQPEAGRAIDKGSAMSIAVADFNGDRKLDLIVGYGDGPIAVYLNDGRANFSGERSRFGRPNAWALATGDMNGDGVLDVVAGYSNGSGGGQNYVYLNDGQGNFAWQGSERMFGGAGHHTHSVAVGDLNGDGALDVVVGNYGYRGTSGRTKGEPNFVYINDGAGNFDQPNSERQLAGDPDNTTSVALGDVNGDGSLDIVVGNAGYDGWQDFVYLNDGSGSFPLSRNLGSGEGTTGLTLADMNGDGALDVIAAHPFTQNAVYINDGTGSFPAARDFTTGWNGAAVVAVGDMDDDGLPDIITGGSSQHGMVTLNRSRRVSGQTDGIRLATLTRPDGSPDANYYASAAILQAEQIPVTYTLHGPADAPVRLVELEYSPDGGGRWLRAMPTTETVTTSLAAAPFPAVTPTNTHVYTWDTFASGFFDQSDDVVLRIKAYPGTGVARNGVPDAFQWPYATAATSPVRVRGTQIQVFSEAKAISNTVSGAYVFRLPADQIAGGSLLANQANEAYRTNARGYLQGASKVVPGDRLVALWPVASTYSYTLYHTSAPPTALGLDAYEVKGPGTQELVVSADNPLLLFNLDVSLEWDARNDGTFLDDLTEAIKRSSEAFYHVSGGQMALGQVRIFQNKENWLNSDVVVYASSSVRPRATMGGVVNTATSDVISATKVITDAFLPGQIRMGPAWDPFGENRADLTLDWQRALAHEFGHYLLYMPDNYLGYDPQGVITTVDCRGSFMTNTYDDQYAKYLNSKDFRNPVNNCGNTIAARLTGRSDWETITKFYPMVHPAGDVPGPAVLPLDVTEVTIIPPDASPTALPARYFDLRDAASGQRVNVAQGQGYLYQTQGTADLRDDRVIPLGSTGRADRLRVRGASPSDRVCVYDDRQTPPRWGCETVVSALSSALRLKEATGWAPNIVVEPQAISAGTTVISYTVPISTTAAPAGRGVITPTVTITGTSALPQNAMAGSTDVPIPSMEPAAPQVSLAPAKPTPNTRTVTETVPLLQPVLAITVTLPEPSPPGQLNIQVLPAYELQSARGPISASWAPAKVVDATNPVTFTQVITLDARIASGFVRVWISDTVRSRIVRESIVQFFVDQDWGPKIELGVWADTSSGFDTNSRGGLGTNSRGGLGTNSRGGLGTNSRGGLGTNSRGGLGTNSRGGLGTNSRGGLGTNSRGGLGTNSRGGLGADQRAWGANHRALGAPVASSDGQVTIFNREDVMADTATGTLQALAAIPMVPQWLTPVGQAYRFEATRPLPRTIGFDYLQREVPPGYEQTLQLYYSPDEGNVWRRLPTGLDINENLATAPADHSGLYMLAASVDIPFSTAGWNLFAYPVPEARPVREALASINGHYTTVFTYDSQDAANPWKVYDTSAPDWVNDLKSLEYGSGYWINFSEPITLQIKVASEAGGERPNLSVGAAAFSNALGRRSPPAIYYGTVSNSAGLAPGQVLTAEIDGQQCGQGTLLPAEGSQDGQGLRYIAKVVASEPGAAPGCGAPDKNVTFKAGDISLVPLVRWDNRRPTNQDLRIGP